MAQRDYILRMIEQMGQVLLGLRRQILGGAAEKRDIEETFRVAAGMGGLDLDVIRGADAETLVLLIGPQADPARCWAIAEILHLDGLNAEAEGRASEARASWEKSVRLYRLLRPAGAWLVGWPEADERIREIEALMETVSPDG